MSRENTAECLKCKTKLKSISLHDTQVCACGSVSIRGGYDHTYAFAGDFRNFSDPENEKEAKDSECKKQCEKNYEENENRISKDDFFDILKAKIRYIEHLPNKASFATNADLHDLYVLLCAFLRSI
jgi:hypothetical protein